MDVLFINPQDSMKLKREINGQLLLGTLLLQEGFTVDILRFCQVSGFDQDYESFIQNIVRHIISSEPKAVSFYSLWPDYHIMLRIAQEVKAVRSDIYTVFGGPQPSLTAEDTMKTAPYVDYICSGEGELTVIPFFTALLRNNGFGLDKIPGLYYRQNGAIVHHNLDHPLCELNLLPHWDDRLYLHHYPQAAVESYSKSYFMPIDVGRGCPFSCTFCCSSKYWRRNYRMKSPDRIISEIKHLINRFNIRSFRFSHDAFTVNKKLVHEICDKIIAEKLDITWKCVSRIDCIDESLILKMKSAGMIEIELGIETGSTRMQQIINKKLNLENAKKTVSFLIAHNLKVDLFFMYGFPEETEQDLADTLALQYDLLDLGVQYASMALCRFNPATVITNKYMDELVLDYSIHHLFLAVFGLPEENHLIEQNKRLFPFYYHLNTPVRNEYSYVFFLTLMYRRHPNSMRLVRELYNGDHIKFCHDFYFNNRSAFDQEPNALLEDIRQNAVRFVKNMLQSFTEPWIPQLLGYLQLDHDLYILQHAKDNMSIQKIYDFNYIDYKLKLPISQYIPGKTEILLQRVDGKVTMSVLNCH